MTSYLLGELSEAELAEIERQYFADAALVDQLIQAESALLDEYARGGLSPETRERVAQRYMAHPTRRERLKFAEALAIKRAELDAAATIQERRPQASDDANASGRGTIAWWRGPGRGVGFSMAACLVLVVTAGWLFVERNRLREESDRTQAARRAQEGRERELQDQFAGERARAQALSTELDRLQAEQSTPSSVPGPARPNSTVVSLVLAVGGVRGPEGDLMRTLPIPPGAEQVRLQFNLEEPEYPGYQVVLQPVGGTAILHRQGLRPVRRKAGWLLVLNVPASTFAAGDYMVTLSGVNRNGDLEDVSKSIVRVEM